MLNKGSTRSKIFTRTRNNMLEDIYKGIDEAPISSEKKKELKQRLKVLASKHIKDPLTSSATDCFLSDLNDIMDKLPLSEGEKNALKSNLSRTVRDNINKYQNDIRKIESKKDRTSSDIDSSPEGDLEKSLNKRRKERTSADDWSLDRDFGKSPDKRRKERTSADDRSLDRDSNEDMFNKGSTRSKIFTRTRNNMLEDIYKGIDEAPISSEKKKELKQRLKFLASKHIKDPLTSSATDCFLSDLNDIMDKLPLSEGEKNALKSNLSRTIRDNINKYQNDIQKLERKKDRTSSDIDSSPEGDLEKSLNKRRKERTSADDWSLDRDFGKSPDKRRKERTSADDRSLDRDSNEDMFNKGSTRSKIFTRTRNNMLEDIYKGIDEAPISSEKKKELKQRLKVLASKHIKDPLTSSATDCFLSDLNDIMDKLPLSEGEKNALKSNLSRTIRDNINKYQNDIQKLERKKDRTSSDIDSSPEGDLEKSLNKRRKERTSADDRSLDRDSNEDMFNKGSTRSKIFTRTRNNMLEDIYKGIDEAPISSEKKKELKQRLKVLASKHIKDPLTSSATDCFLSDLNDIMDKLPLSEGEKNALKSNLSRTVRGNINKYQNDIQKLERKKDITSSDIDSSPEGDLEKSLNKRRKERTSADDWSLDRDFGKSPDKRRKERTSADDRSLDRDSNEDMFNKGSTRSKIFTRTRNNMLEDIYKGIDEAPISSEKKKELKQRLKVLASKHIKDPLTSSATDCFLSDLNDIMEKLPLSEGEKNALKSNLSRTVRDNINKYQNDIRKIESKKDRTSSDIDSSPEGDLEKSLNKRRKERTSADDWSLDRDFGKSPDKRRKERTSADDRSLDRDSNEDMFNKGSTRSKIFTRTRNNMLEDIYKGIDEAPISSEKKKELKQRLKVLASKHIKDPLTSSATDCFLSDLNDIMDKLPLSEGEKNALKSNLSRTVRGNINKYQNDIQKLERKKDRTSSDIDSSPEGDLEKSLNKRRKERTSADDWSLDRDFGKSPDKRRKERTSADDRSLDRDSNEDMFNKGSTRSKIFTRTRNNMLEDIYKGIDEAPISSEKKKELKQRLKFLASKHIKDPLTSSATDCFLSDLNDIMDKLPLSEDEKNALKSNLSRTIRDNINKYQNDIQKIESKKDRTSSDIDSSPEGDLEKSLNKRRKERTSADDRSLDRDSNEDMFNKGSTRSKIFTRTRNNMLEDIYKGIDEAPISSEKKKELKQRLKFLASKHIKDPLTSSATDCFLSDLNDIMDKLPLSEGEKNALKSNLSRTVRGNINKYQNDIRKIESKKDRTSSDIDSSPEGDLEKSLNKRRKERTSADDWSLDRDFGKSPDKRRKERTSADDRSLDRDSNEDMFNKGSTRSKIFTRTRNNMLEDIYKGIDEAPISSEKKKELKQRLKVLASKHIKDPLTSSATDCFLSDLNDIMDKLPLSEGEKNALKSNLSRTVRDNINKYQNDIQKLERKKDRTSSDIDSSPEGDLEKSLNKRRKGRTSTEIDSTQEEEFEKSPDKRRKERTSADDWSLDRDFGKLPAKRKTERTSAEIDAPLDRDFEKSAGKRRKERTSAEGADRSLDGDFDRSPDRRKSQRPSIEEADPSLERDHKKSTDRRKKQRTSFEEEEDLQKSPDTRKKQRTSIEEVDLDKSTDRRKKQRTSFEEADDSQERDLQKSLDGRKKQKTSIEGAEFEKYPGKRKKDRTSVEEGDPSLDRDSNEEMLNKFGSTRSKIFNRTRNNILEDIYKGIDGAPLSSEKKKELKQRVKFLASKHLIDPLTSSATDSFLSDINDIMDKLPLSEAEKNALKSNLSRTTRDNINKYQNDIHKMERKKDRTSVEEGGDPSLDRDSNEEMFNKFGSTRSKIFTRTRNNILEDIYKGIDGAPISSAKKKELKQRVKFLASKHLIDPLTSSATDSFLSDINDIMDKLPLSEDEKNTLKSNLSRSLRDNINKYQKEINKIERKNLQTKEDNYRNRRNKQAADENPDSSSHVFRRKETKSLEHVRSRAEHDIFQDEIEDDVKRHNITGEKARVSLVSDDGTVLRGKESILQWITETVDESDISDEKKKQIKIKLSKMARESWNEFENIQEALKVVIGEIDHGGEEDHRESDAYYDNVTDPNDESLESYQYSSMDDDEYGSGQGEKTLLPNNKTREKEICLQVMDKVIYNSPFVHEKKIGIESLIQDGTLSRFENTVEVAPIAKKKKQQLKSILKVMYELASTTIINMNKSQSEISNIIQQQRNIERKYKQFRRDGYRRRLISLEEVNPYLAKESIMHGMENAIEISNIPYDQKKELHYKLDKMAAENLQQPLSADVQKAVKTEISRIMKEMPIPKDERSKLRRGLKHSVDDSLEFLRDATKNLELNVLSDVLRYTEKVNTEAPISKHEMEFKQKLSRIANLEQPSSVDVQKSLNNEIEGILNELSIPTVENERFAYKNFNSPIFESTLNIPQLPADKKKRIKSYWTEAVNENISVVQNEIADTEDGTRGKKISAEQQRVKQELVLEAMKKTIEESNMPERKKKKIRKKLNAIAEDNKNDPLSANVQKALKVVVGEILVQIKKPKDDMSTPNLVGDVSAAQRQKRKKKSLTPLENIDPSLARVSILQGLDTTIENSNIHEENKRELQTKLNKMTEDKLQQPLSPDVKKAVKAGIGDILKEIPIPKEERSKLRRGLKHSVDDSLESLRDTSVREETHTTNLENIVENVLHDLENSLDDLNQNQDNRDLVTSTRNNLIDRFYRTVEEAPISAEQKPDLNQKLKDVAYQHLTGPLTSDPTENIIDGIDNILDQMPLSQDQKKKLRFDLTKNVYKTIQEYKSKLADIPWQTFKSKRDSTRNTHNISKTSINTQEFDSSQIKDRITPGKEENKRDERGGETITRTFISREVGDPSQAKAKTIPEEDENESDERKGVTITKTFISREVGDPSQAKDRIMPGKEENEPDERKGETITKTFITRKEGDASQARARIIAEKGASPKHVLKDEEAPGKKGDKVKIPFEEIDPVKAKERILQDMEKAIEDAPISEEKKIELKKKLNKMVAENLKRPLSEGTQDAMKNEIQEILKVLNIPENEKNKLKNYLKQAVDENLSLLRLGESRSQIEHNIFYDLEDSVHGSPLFLKKETTVMNNEHYSNRPSSDDVQFARKGNIPNDDRKRISQTKQDSRTDKFTGRSLTPLEKVDPSLARESIMQGMEKTIENSAIPDENKKELQNKLNKMASDTLQQPLSADVQKAVKSGIGDILKEMPIPKEERSKLRRGLKHSVDQSLESLRDSTKLKEHEKLEHNAPDKLSNIVKLSETSIVSKPDSLKARFSNRPSSDDVQFPRKGNINDSPKVQTSTLGNNGELSKANHIFEDIEKAINDSPISEEKKAELRNKLSKMADGNIDLSPEGKDRLKNGIEGIINELPLLKADKNKLLSKVDENFDSLIEKEKKELQVLENLSKNNTIQALEELIDEADIPEEMKNELKEKIKELARNKFDRRLSNYVRDEFIDGINDIIDGLDLPKDMKDKMKSEFKETVDDGLSVFLKLKQMHPSIHPQSMQKEGEKVHDLTEFDPEKAKESIKMGIKRSVKRSLLPSLAKKKLQSELADMIDKEELIYKATKKEDVDPSYIKKLESSIMRELRDTGLSGDIDSIRSKLIEKIMRETHLPEEEAMKLADQIIKRGLGMPPSFGAQGKRGLIALSAAEILNKMPYSADDELALEERRKIFEDKCHNDISDAITNAVDKSSLPEDKKTDLKSTLLSKLDEELQKKPIANQQDFYNFTDDILENCKNIVDNESDIPSDNKSELKTLLDNEFNKKMFESKCKYFFTPAINNAVDRSSISETTKAHLKSTLLNKLDENIQKKPITTQEDLEFMNNDLLKDFKKMINNRTDISNEQKTELKALLDEELNKKMFQNKCQNFIADAITDAVDKSTITETQKTDLAPKLLSKLDENVQKTSILSQKDFDNATAEILKDSKEIVDNEPDISIDNKNELKKLLDEAFNKKMFENKCKNLISTGIHNAINRSSMAEDKKLDLISSLESKLDESTRKTTMASQEDFNKLVDEMLKDSKEIVDNNEFDISNDQKTEVKSLLEEEFEKLKFKNKCQNVIANAIIDAVERSSNPESVKADMKPLLLSKLQGQLEKTPITNQTDLENFMPKILGEEKNVVNDQPDMPIDKKNELKSLLEEEFKNKMFENKCQDLIATAVTNAVDRSSSPDSIKEGLIPLLLNKLEEQFQKTPITTQKDFENFVPELMWEEKNIVDNYSDMPMDKQSELKALLDEEFKNKIFENKCANLISTAITNAVDKSSNPESVKEDLKPSLLVQLNENFQKSPILTQNDFERMAPKLLLDSKKIVDNRTDIPTDKKKELILLLEEEFKQKMFENKGQHLISTAVSDAINQSSIPEITKADLKSSILNKLDEKIQQHPIATIQDLEYIKNEILNDSKDIVDNEHNIDNDEKTEVKFLLTEALDGLNDVIKSLRVSFEGLRDDVRKFNRSASIQIPQEYTENLSKLIQSWVEALPVAIDPAAQPGVVKDLTNDIIDRLKYLKVQDGAICSNKDELENLKYQVFRRFNKLVHHQDMPPIMEATPELFKMITGLGAPDNYPGLRHPSITDGQDGGSTRPTAKELEEIRKKMNGEIGDILANCGLDEKEREALQASLGNELERLAKSGATPEEMRRALIEKIKKESNMTDEEAEQLADKLLGVAKNLSLASKFQGAGRPSVNRTSQMRDRPSQSQKRDSSKQRRDSYPPGKSRDISAARRWPCCGKSPVQRKDFQEAMLRELGDVFHGCPMSEEKRKLMERQLAEQYARELGIPLEDGDFSDRKLDPVITATVNDWVRALPITITTNQEDNDLENDKLELITRLNEIIPMGDFSKVNGEVHRFMQRVPLDPELKNDEEFMNKKSRELIDNLISGARRRGSRYGMSFNGLTDYIEAWLNNLHIDDPTKGEEQMKDMKKDMAYNLVHKIGEMNVDPEIFNDNLLYEDVLRDEIENMLAGVTITDPNLQELKDELVAKALEARRRAHDEMVGQNYKQNLRDTISNMLPDQRNMSYDEQASLEILKDQLADAFINLHYSGNDDNLRGQIKRKISSEIAAFCNNYMRRHPGIPLNSQKLNYDLYTALNDVPLPCGDSMRYEVEQARIREEIDEWVRDLPLEPQSAAELLARNKMVYVLSKKIFDIEVEADDKVELMRKRILEFLNKMPVRPSENLNALAERLIDKLNATELYRRFSESANVTIDAFGNAIPSPGPPCTNAPNSPTCPYFKTRMNLLPSSPCTRTFQSDRTVEHTRPRRTFPCTLSPEDMAHLERIRRRACLSPKCVSSLLKNKRNAAVGPKPVDTESQTDIRANAGPVCPTNDDRQPRPCPGVQTSTSRASGIQTKNRPTSSCNMQTEGEVDPQIIVKEFYWDSPDNSKRMPCHQTGPQPYQQPATGPCNLSGTAPCQSPYYPPSGSPYQQSGSPYQLSPPLQQPGASLYPRTSPGPSTLSGTSSYLPSGPPCHQMGTSPFQSFSHRPPHQTGRSPSHPPSRPPCHPPSHPSSRSPCHRSSSPHYTPGSFSSHQNYLSPQASPTHQGQSISAQRMPCDFSSYKAPPSHSHRESCSQWSSRGFDDRTSRRSSPCSRSPPASPHLSPFSSPFGPNHQSTPLNSPGYSCRLSDSRMQKRDGLQDQIPCTSSRQSRRERVIELGSLDDLRHPRPSKKRNSNNWSSKCSDEENSWGSPVMRRVILDEGIDEQRMMERELGQGQREERVKCKCKDRLSLKSTRSQTFHTQCATTTSEEGHNSNHLTRCSKCCGLHCPYPSFLYFRE
ncbi:uncharacterized protein LOC135118912 isoform X2 [Helicoverpa armigera]|uniref:uncharacterized protein LOC135118912 isoform X2 n=1 Tax=Helicoverpa armigera TaxID=29058 RepID=UPI003083B6BF